MTALAVGMSTIGTTVGDLGWVVAGTVIVVTLCVITLLSLLVSFVTDIDQAVDRVDREVAALVENTRHTDLLNGSAVAIGDLGAELAGHAEVLGSITGARR